MTRKKTNTTKSPTHPPKPRWRRRSYQVAALLAALAAGALLLANSLLANHYTPQGAVDQYLRAIKSGDARTASSTVEVAAPGSPVSQSLTDLVSLRAALAYGHSDLRSFDITGAQFIDAGGTLAQVEVSYETSDGTRQTNFMVEQGAGKNFAIYPSWRVVIQPALIKLDLPAGGVGVIVDGKSLALDPGQSTIAVWPVAHSVVFKGTSMLEPGSVAIDAFASPGESVSYQPKLTPASVTKAADAIKAAFASCAEQTSLQPEGCPQRFDDTWVATGQWEIMGDPTKDLALSFDPQGNLSGTGHFQMIVAYQISGTDGTMHFPSGGGYSAALSLSSSEVTVSSIQSSAGLEALQRPAAVSDKMISDLVAKAFAACAKARSGSPADCPQQFFFPDAQGFSWILNGDPRAGANVSFDQNSGLFSVHGSFDMTASYSLAGYPYSQQSSTAQYDAYLYWDGQALQLVTIAGSYA